MGIATGVALGVIMICLSVLTGLGFYSVLGRTRAAPPAPASAPRAPSTQSAKQEHSASLAVERIEERVNIMLSRTPGLEATRVDFGTAEDGSLEIWIGDRKFAGLSEIDDPRIRQVIETAVTAFNL